MVATGRLLNVDPDVEVGYRQHVKDLRRQQAPLVVYGGRGYEIVSAFGTYRFHGASVLFFDDVRQELDRFFAGAKKVATKAREIAAHTVFVFPADKDEMESVYKLQPWQGTYLTRLEPNVLLCATSDIYLKEMLERIDRGADDRPLPPHLPEWKYVDMSASVWGLRHIPPVENHQLAGLVWRGEPASRAVFEVFYFPSPRGNVEKFARDWFHKREAGEAIQSLPDGATKVTLELENLGCTFNFPMFQLYHLQGYAGTR